MSPAALINEVSIAELRARSPSPSGSLCEDTLLKFDDTEGVSASDEELFLRRLELMPTASESTPWASSEAIRKAQESRDAELKMAFERQEQERQRRRERRERRVRIEQEAATATYVVELSEEVLNKHLKATTSGLNRTRDTLPSVVSYMTTSDVSRVRQCSSTVSTEDEERFVHYTSQWHKKLSQILLDAVDEAEAEVSQ